MKENNPIQTVVGLNFWYLCLNHPINNLNVKIDNVIHDNGISTYNMVVMDNFNDVSVVITTHFREDITVSIRKIITK